MPSIKDVLGFQDIEEEVAVRILSLGRIIGESCTHAFYHSSSTLGDFEKQVKEELSKYIGKKIPGSNKKFTKKHYQALCFLALNPSVKGLNSSSNKVIKLF